MDWAVLGWVVLGWAALGWIGLVWLGSAARLASSRTEPPRRDKAGLCVAERVDWLWVGLDWVGLGWVGWARCGLVGVGVARIGLVQFWFRLSGYWAHAPRQGTGESRANGKSGERVGWGRFGLGCGGQV